MKFISMILLAVFLGKGCDSQQEKDLASAVVEYTANTRGFFYKITIQDKQVLVSRDRNGFQKPESKAIPEAEWKALVAEFSKVDLDKLSTLKAPTEKRFYDGAAIANLKVTYKEKTYETTDFDDGFPPAEIATLVNKITAYKPSRE
ncbi:hypothetical protein [Flavobacterium sp.]|uniref:hypothetical protein n=1 Tax=Flavobacterium sp. TaxID=239 RepID=UPI001213C1B5|nr:hypothetical protein [Flavobacterium sp.]RZJ71894.1 MAG: hypothetical protein EOO49_07650 [Flavobacterium sp.]